MLTDEQGENQEFVIKGGFAEQHDNTLIIWQICLLKRLV